MTYCKFFTLLAAMAGSIWSVNASAIGHSRLLEVPSSDSLSVSVDSLKLQVTTVTDTSVFMLSPEELALMVETVPNEPDDVIADRLSCIESDIPLVFNDFVRNFIDYFTIRNRKYTRTMLTRENVYFPLFEKYLKKHNMPDELKYLAIVESGLNPLAQSPVGAAGLWQFMKPTGREYGLHQTQYVDERLDPEKSTEAAMLFLRRLYKYYDDWELALAAYNCGQGNVNKAIRKAGGKKSFWDIFPYLPRETRGYVPSMTAVRYAMNYAGEHNIFSDSILYQPEVAYLEVTQELEVERLAAELHLTPEEILALNPELKKNTVPGNKYKLRIPSSRASLLATNEDKSCILMAAAPAPLQQKVQEQAPVMLASAKTEEAPEPRASAKTSNITYTVQRGDNLSSIARRHDVTVDQLKEWNNLNSSYIAADQKLQILQQGQPTGAVLAVNNDAKSNAKSAVEKRELIYHVQPGDTLWQISRKYDGITIEQIKKLNKLKSNNLKPGQKLILS
ncbi:lytic transglycosylase domain-containing protein [Pontibacter anaerobius]|uniref:LysM peptidoglycan-binding domain-containing protein n=1 Tax=Pontibacter anaerobius TaxID=2993940 RepID=A0ABT3RLQ8_9BACT|nr:lytic transglycosylase domain-containing protein [Pontibacter anaerobius]MCX2742120.1 LysM peptidoglycan-binding domain-containing protein [Pontibacter anaerobius]